MPLRHQLPPAVAVARRRRHTCILMSVDGPQTLAARISNRQKAARLLTNKKGAFAWEGPGNAGGASEARGRLVGFG